MKKGAVTELAPNFKTFIDQLIPSETRYAVGYPATYDAKRIQQAVEGLGEVTHVQSQAKESMVDWVIVQLKGIRGYEVEQAEIMFSPNQSYDFPEVDFSMIAKKVLLPDRTVIHWMYLDIYGNVRIFFALMEKIYYWFVPKGWNRRGSVIIICFNRVIFVVSLMIENVNLNMVTSMSWTEVSTFTLLRRHWMKRAGGYYLLGWVSRMNGSHASRLFLTTGFMR